MPFFSFQEKFSRKCFAEKHFLFTFVSTFTDTHQHRHTKKMNLDWTTIITALISAIAGGGLIGIFTMKQTRESKDLDNAEKVVEKYEKLIERYKSISEANEKKVEELTNKLNEISRKLSIAETKIENLQLMYRNANYMRCNNLNCKKRTPPMSEDIMKMLIATSADKKEEAE